MLLLQFININKPPIKISGGTISIGQDNSNDVIIDEPGISDFHAEMMIEENRILLSDLLSENGTFVNNQRISRNKELHPWDRIKLASIEIEISEAEKYRPGDWALKKESDLLNSQYIPLQTLTSVGRAPDCDLVILDGLLSRKHTLLTIEGERLLVEDLKSANGTFINNIKINTAYASPGDEITFDTITFELLGPCPHGTSSPIEDNTIIRDEEAEEAEEATILASHIDNDKTQIFQSKHSFNDEKTIVITSNQNNEKTILLTAEEKAEQLLKPNISSKYRSDLMRGITGFILSLLIGLSFYYFLR